MMGAFRTIEQPAQIEQIIKKSRFIAHCQTVNSAAEARTFLDDVADQNANHNCWAFRSGQSYRFDDDGEPGGTAGQPILNAIDGAGLDHVAVVVTRYFGGIKLGTGGLVRAYRGAAAACLLAGGETWVHSKAKVTVYAPFDCIGLLHRLAEKHAASVLRERFEADGAIMTIEVDEARLSQFRSEATDLSSGRCKLTI